MSEEKFIQLIRGHIDNTLTEAQEEQLFAWIKDPAYLNLLEAFIDESILLPQSKEMGIRDERLQEISRFILSKGQPAKIRRFPSWTRVAVAASVMLVLSLGAWLLYNNQTSNRDKSIVVQANDVQAPATNRAMITLADGRTIYLDSAGNGTLASQSGVTVIKTADGQIVYDVTLGTEPAEVPFNTLHNPRGSKVIDLTLSDGSRVWLNAGSSLTYPVAFIGNERKVSFDGEAYFEISPDASKPFKLTKGDLEVAVLGTHFNVNAYDDENKIKVTLLEGSVSVTAKQLNNSTILKPGQQAEITNTKLSTINNVDLESVMAWKNGLFTLNGTGMESLMRQVSRWYDVDIVYTSSIPARKFGGTIGRNVNLSTLLKALNEQGVDIRLEGRRVIVGEDK